MEEYSYYYAAGLYGGIELLICSGNPFISMEEETYSYAGRQLLICSGNTFISMEEYSYQYGGRQLLVCRKTVVSMQEDIGKTGEDTNGDYSADLLLLASVS